MLDVCEDKSLRDQLVDIEASLEHEGSSASAQEKQAKLETYLKTIDPDRVDLELTARLVHRIDCYTPKEEAVLVFLPGLDDILTLKKVLLSGEFRLKGAVEITVLHSSIQSKDQKNAFRIPPPGVRKVLLSTNISESSITVRNCVEFKCYYSQIEL